MSALREALRWRTKGVAAIPIEHRGKRPVVKWAQYQNALPTEQELRAWFTLEGPNLAVITGWRGLTVLDFDDRKVYAKWRLWAARQAGMAALAVRSYSVRTGRGVHVYVRLPRATKTRPLRQGDDPAKIDVKSAGGYVLAPPSTHPSGSQYTAIDPGAMILGVKALSDVLPIDLLIAPQPEQKANPKLELKSSNDPWLDVERTKADIVIGQTLIDRIRATFPIESFFNSRMQSGDHWALVQCPFHEDHKPSMWINTDTGYCKCFAGCTGDKPYDVINLFARQHDLTNNDAILVLARRF